MHPSTHTQRGVHMCSTNSKEADMLLHEIGKEEKSGELVSKASITLAFRENNTP